ncbi:MAG: GntR family transcriptional regulator [Vicinamibacterales bacterium]
MIGASQTLAERVYDVVRDRIIAKALPPRSYVREEELATCMGVSRTPVREALSRLASEGFLERITHRGFRVPERSIEELAQTYVVLQSLELLASELAFPRITSADLARLEAANAAFAAAVHANDVTTAVDLNDHFHHILSELSGNPVLSRMLADLRGQVHRLEVIDFSSVMRSSNGDSEGTISGDTWVGQHADFIDALREREHDRAMEIMRGNRSFFLARKVAQHGSLNEPDQGAK